MKGLHIRAAGNPWEDPARKCRRKNTSCSLPKTWKKKRIGIHVRDGKRVYNANDVRAKLPDTADAWTAACFLAKNVMKFLKGLLWLLFEKSKLSLGKKFLMMDRIFFVQLPTAV